MSLWHYLFPISAPREPLHLSGGCMFEITMVKTPLFIIGCFCHTVSLHVVGWVPSSSNSWHLFSKHTLFYETSELPMPTGLFLPLCDSPYSTSIVLLECLKVFYKALPFTTRTCFYNRNQFLTSILQYFNAHHISCFLIILHFDKLASFSDLGLSPIFVDLHNLPTGSVLVQVLDSDGGLLIYLILFYPGRTYRLYHLNWLLQAPTFFFFKFLPLSLRGSFLNLVDDILHIVNETQKYLNNSRCSPHEQLLARQQDAVPMPRK